jgi:Na+/H+-translocating membrane pyrophosphatase
MTSFLATDIFPVKVEKSIELALRTQLVVTTLIMIPATYYLAVIALPAEFIINGVSHDRNVTAYGAFICVTTGTLGGLLNGLFTEYYTSKEYEPVRELAESVSSFPLCSICSSFTFNLSLPYLVYDWCSYKHHLRPRSRLQVSCSSRLLSRRSHLHLLPHC